jgi:hypothetical protein
MGSMIYALGGLVTLQLPDCRQPLPWDYFRVARHSGGVAKTRQERLSPWFADFVVH